MRASDRTWTLEQLERELDRFDAELRAGGLKPAFVDTYVSRSRTFLRWLAGEYHRRSGP